MVWRLRVPVAIWLAKLPPLPRPPLFFSFFSFFSFVSCNHKFATMLFLFFPPLSPSFPSFSYFFFFGLQLYVVVPNDGDGGSGCCHYCCSYKKMMNRTWEERWHYALTLNCNKYKQNTKDRVTQRLSKTKKKQTPQSYVIANKIIENSMQSTTNLTLAISS